MRGEHVADDAGTMRCALDDPPGLTQLSGLSPAARLLSFFLLATQSPKLESVSLIFVDLRGKPVPPADRRPAEIVPVPTVSDALSRFLLGVSLAADRTTPGAEWMMIACSRPGG